MTGFIGRFKITREIGLGGVGRVYCAKDPLLKRNVALKLLLAGEFADERELARFQREVENCARLRHSNIVPLYEVGREPGKGIYMVMEYVEGVSLEDYIHQNQIYPHQAAQITCILARAVHYAHQQGIIHRDLKPQNILMRDHKSPMITDFGLARRMGGEAKDRLTQTGDIVGTPGHMAPEQINGENPIPQMDVYALGSIFYELLTGSSPYKGESVEILYHILDETESSPNPRQIKPEIARDLDIICRKAMHKDYRKRYESAAALADDIELYLQGKPVKARPLSFLERSYLWSRRHFVTSLTIFLCSLGIFIAIVIAQILQQHKISQKISHYLDEGDELCAQVSTSSHFNGSYDWLPLIRQARYQYEKALALDFQDLRVREKLYRLEILYGRTSLEEGLLERAEDAVSAAEFLGIQTPELKELQDSLQQERKILQVLSRLRKRDSSGKIDDIVQVLNRYPEKAIRYIIGNLTDPETRKLAEQIFHEQIPPILANSPSLREILSIPYLAKPEARALGYVIDQAYPEAIPELLMELEKTDLRSTVNIVVMAGAAQHRKAAGVLIAMLTSPEKNPHWQNPAVQLEICEALGELKSSQAIRPLVECFSKSPTLNVSIAAAGALAKFGPEARVALPVLLEKLRPQNPISLRLASWKALMQISPDKGYAYAAAALKDPATPPELYAEIWAFWLADSSRFSTFIESLAPTSCLENTSLQLSRLSKTGRTLLLERLMESYSTTTSQRLQQKAVKIAAEVDQEKTPEFLRLALSSSYPSVRKEAALALCRITESGPYVPLIRQVLESEKDRYVKFYLSWAVSKIKKTDVDLTKGAQAMRESRELPERLAGMLLLQKSYKNLEDLLEILK